MKRTSKRRKRPAPIRALAVWVETPVLTTWDEQGRPICFHQPGFCVWLDEKRIVQSRPLKRWGKRQIVPKFKIVSPGPGIALELGRRPGDYTIVSRPS